jgi:WD40 repeat protein
MKIKNAAKRKNMKKNQAINSYF